MKFYNPGWKKLLAAAILLPFMIGTSPIFPLFRYIVQGHISRPEGRGKDNFVVTVMAKFVSNLPEPQEIELASFIYPGSSNRIKSVTDSTGMFSLDVSVDRKADSIAVRISAPDKPAFVSAYIALKDAALTEIISKYSDPSMPGCSGCGNEPKYSTYVSTYQYNFPDQTVNLPY